MGRGSSGKGRGKKGTAGAAPKNTGWREDYDKAKEAERIWHEKARAMDEQVKAAKDAYYNAPTRSKAQKAEAEKLKEEMDRLTTQQSMLQYRAAQAATFADRLRMENDTRYRNQQNKEAARRARLGYR